MYTSWLFIEIIRITQNRSYLTRQWKSCHPSKEKSVTLSHDILSFWPDEAAFWRITLMDAYNVRFWQCKIPNVGLETDKMCKNCIELFAYRFLVSFFLAQNTLWKYLHKLSIWRILLSVLSVLRKGTPFSLVTGPLTWLPITDIINSNSTDIYKFGANTLLYF
jgi:hypothetical protein